MPDPNGKLETLATVANWCHIPRERADMQDKGISHSHQYRILLALSVLLIAVPIHGLNGLRANDTWKKWRYNGIPYPCPIGWAAGTIHRRQTASSFVSHARSHLIVAVIIIRRNPTSKLPDEGIQLTPMTMTFVTSCLPLHNNHSVMMWDAVETPYYAFMQHNVDSFPCNVSELSFEVCVTFLWSWTTHSRETSSV